MELMEEISKKPVFRCRPPLSNRDRPHPFLVITDGKENERQTFYNLSEGRFYMGIIPEMHNKTIRACRDGWLVLEDNQSDDCCLLNILSTEEEEEKKVQQLPPLLDSAVEEYETCILSSAPSDPDCRVMFFDGSNRRLLINKPAEDDHNKYSFVQQELLLDDVEHLGYLKSATFLEGKIYGLMVGLQSAALVVADLKEPANFREVKLELDPQLLFGCSHSYLVESCGEILLVRNNSLGMGTSELLNFEVYKADFSKKVWVKMTSIGERAIFLDTFQGFSCSTAGLEGGGGGGVRRNSIYFTYLEDRNIYVFDLEDQSISMFLPCPIVSSRDSILTWIMMPATDSSV